MATTTTPATTEKSEKDEKEPTKFQVQADGGLSFIIKETSSPVSEFIKKRFHSVLDIPEQWEKNMKTTNNDTCHDNDNDNISSKNKRVKKESTSDFESKSIAEISDTSQSSHEINTSFQNRSRADIRKRRRNAIIPNSMTQRMIRNVADGYNLEVEAETTGKFIIN